MGTDGDVAVVDEKLIYVNGNQKNAARRQQDEPAPTVHFGHAQNQVEWLLHTNRDQRKDSSRQSRPAPAPAPALTGKSGGQWYREPCDDPLELKGEDWPERRPATTMAGDPRQFQPGGHHGEGEQSQNAVRVSVEEAAVLQGFRSDYPFQGSRTKQFEQVGNAVPPPLARAVIAALLGRDG